MSEATRYDRRRFIGTAVMATAGAGLVGARFREFEFDPAAATPGANVSPGRTKQINAGNLRVGYAEAGPANGPPAILLHNGINGDVDVAALVATGYRVLVPYARASGTKRLGSSVMIRTGHQTVVPPDVIALMDGLRIEKALVGGFDESARIADVMAALWPQRVKGIVPVCGYPVVTLAANQRPLPPKEELAWWYQYYFAQALPLISTDTIVQWNRVASRANVHRVDAT